MLKRDSDIDECCRRSLSDVGMFDCFENEVNYVIENDGFEKSALEIASTINLLIKFRENNNEGI
jgi:hypothetical protein